MSAPPSSARDVALAVVRDVFPNERGRRERGAQEALDYRARRAGLSERDRAFATELAYGAIKMRRALDAALQPFVGERRHALPPVVAEILRLGAYELLYTRADAHATVFEFVNLAKRYGHRGLGNLANAVLRGLLRHPPAEPQPAAFASLDDYLGARYSLPDWLVRRWREAFGDDALQAVCAAVNEPARAAVVVNRAVLDRADAAKLLNESGVEAAPSDLAGDALVVLRGAARLPDLERGDGSRWWTQSESSALAVDLLDPQPGDAVLDLCSGRGNKALQIAARLDGGNLTCVERQPGKAAELTRRLSVAGMAAAVVTGDATDPELPLGEAFDRVLVDAPCSAIGLVGRHPEARWKKRPDDGERLAVTQTALLRRAAARLRQGGTLVYAVCSNDRSETSGVVDAAVADGTLRRIAGDAVIEPGVNGRDGFYFARLTRL